MTSAAQAAPHLRTPLRKDAARNRAAILDAARELFACGRDVPMYEIGRRAGVGQATLYRHFPDRAAIVATITLEHVERIEALAAQRDGASPTVATVLAAATEMLVCIQDLLGSLREDVALAPILDELRERTRTVLANSLERSRATEGLRDDVDTDDLMLVLKMINGALVGVSTTTERTAAAGRALEIAARGLRE